MANKEILIDYFKGLPRTRLYENWGDEVVVNGDNSYLVNKSDNISFFIRQFFNECHVTIYKDNKELLNFYDIYNPTDNYDIFMRYISNYQLYYNNNNYHIIK
jgi:spore coat protein CotH